MYGPLKTPTEIPEVSIFHFFGAWPMKAHLLFKEVEIGKTSYTVVSANSVLFSDKAESVLSGICLVQTIFASPSKVRRS